MIDILAVTILTVLFAYACFDIGRCIFVDLFIRSIQTRTQLIAVNPKKVEPDVNCATKPAVINKGVSTPSGDDLNQQSCLGCRLMAKLMDDKNLTLLENERLANELSLLQSQLADSNSQLQMFQSVHEELVAITKSELEKNKSVITEMIEKNLEKNQIVLEKERLVNELSLLQSQLADSNSELRQSQNELAITKTELEEKKRFITDIIEINLRLVNDDSRLRRQIEDMDKLNIASIFPRPQHPPYVVKDEDVLEYIAKEEVGMRYPSDEIDPANELYPRQFLQEVTSKQRSQIKPWNDLNDLEPLNPEKPDVEWRIDKKLIKLKTLCIKDDREELSMALLKPESQRQQMVLEKPEQYLHETLKQSIRQTIKYPIHVTNIIILDNSIVSTTRRKHLNGVDDCKQDGIMKAPASIRKYGNHVQLITLHRTLFQPTKCYYDLQHNSNIAKFVRPKHPPCVVKAKDVLRYIATEEEGMRYLSDEKDSYELYPKAFLQEVSSNQRSQIEPWNDVNVLELLNPEKPDVLVEGLETDDKLRHKPGDPHILPGIPEKSDLSEIKDNQPHQQLQEDVLTLNRENSDLLDMKDNQHRQIPEDPQVFLPNQEKAELLEIKDNQPRHKSEDHQPQHLKEDILPFNPEKSDLLEIKGNHPQNLQEDPHALSLNPEKSDLLEKIDSQSQHKEEDIDMGYIPYEADPSALYPWSLLKELQSISFGSQTNQRVLEPLNPEKPEEVLVKGLQTDSQPQHKPEDPQVILPPNQIRSDLLEMKDNQLKPENPPNPEKSDLSENKDNQPRHKPEDTQVDASELYPCSLLKEVGSSLGSQTKQRIDQRVPEPLYPEISDELVSLQTLQTDSQPQHKPEDPQVILPPNQIKSDLQEKKDNQPRLKPDDKHALPQNPEKSELVKNLEMNEKPEAPQPLPDCEKGNQKTPEAEEVEKRLKAAEAKGVVNAKSPPAEVSSASSKLVVADEQKGGNSVVMPANSKVTNQEMGSKVLLNNTQKLLTGNENPIKVDTTPKLVEIKFLKGVNFPEAKKSDKYYISMRVEELHDKIWHQDKKIKSETVQGSQPEWNKLFTIKTQNPQSCLITIKVKKSWNLGSKKLTIGYTKIRVTSLYDGVPRLKLYDFKSFDPLGNARLEVDLKIKDLPRSDPSPAEVKRQQQKTKAKSPK